MLNIKLQQLGITRRTSGKQKCPRCSDGRKNKSDPCLSVTFQPDRVLWNCHNCGWSDAAFDEEKPQRVYKKPKKPEPIGDMEKVYTFFKNDRKISRKTVDRFDISYVTHYFSQLKKEESCICFPYYKNGEFVNAKYRTAKKEFTQEGNTENPTEKTFFGMDLIKNYSQLIITEGEFDTMALWEVGFEAVSVPQGATENKLECIENCWLWLQKFDTYIICVDNDDAGKILEYNLIRRLGKYKCKVVKFKQDKDDANEVLKRNPQELKEVIENAEYVPVPGIGTFLDSYDEIMAWWSGAGSSPVSTGWKGLDDLLKICTGYVMTVTGIPNHGKSFWIDNLLYNLSKNEGWNHLKWDAENSKIDLFRKYTEIKTRKTTDRNSPNRPTDEEVHNAFIDFDSIKVIDTTKYNDVDEIIEFTKYAVGRWGVKTLTIDNYVSLEKTFETNETDWIAKFVRRMSTLAKELDILVILVAHPTKRSPNKDMPKIPNPYEMSGSAHWVDLADYCISIFRETFDDGKMSKETIVRVNKIRHKDLGECGTGYLIWERFRLVDSITKDFKNPPKWRASGNDAI